MVDPSFISLDDSFHEVVTFSTIVIQKPFADAQTFLFAQFCALLWDPSCRDFMEGKPVVHNFTGWPMKNLQLMCYFISSHSSVLQYHVMDSFHVCISNGCGWTSNSFLMLNACMTILEHLDPFICSNTMLFLYCTDILLCILACDTPSDQKKQITALCSSFMQVKSRASIFMAQNSPQIWTIKVTAPQW